VSVCFAQDIGSSDSSSKGDNQQNVAIFQFLSTTPASALDVSLLRLQQRLMASLVSNKPQIFRRGGFDYFDVDYEATLHIILVESSYRSAAMRPDELAAECKDDVDLVLSALTIDVPDTNLLGSTRERSKLSCANVNTMFTSKTDPLAEPDVCKSLVISFHVEADDEKSGVYCSRRFTDKDTRVKSDR
jgi:hypothetical protein